MVRTMHLLNIHLSYIGWSRLIMMMIGNFGLGPGKCIRIFSHSLGSHSSARHRPIEERSPLVLPLRDVELEEMYTVCTLWNLYWLWYYGLPCIHSFICISYNQYIVWCLYISTLWFFYRYSWWFLLAECWLNLLVLRGPD